MVLSNSLQDIQDYIDQNDLKIQYLHEINSTLKDEYELQSNYESLSQKFKFLKKEEQDQLEKLNHTRKKYLLDIELKGTELCKEHAKLLHQIEHLQWHFEKGSTKHESRHAVAIHSCKSSATSLNRSLMSKSFDTANLENTSERLIKTIADLRRRIYNAKQKLDKEINDISEAKLENVSTISGISMIHSVAFEKGTMKYWKYFNNGEGKEKHCVDTKSMAKYTIHSSFDDCLKNAPIVPHTTTKRYNFPYYCQTYSCDASFDTSDELDSHILEGNHHLIPITSSSDLIKSTYRQVAPTDFRKFYTHPISKEPVPPKVNGESKAEAHFKIGWALPHRSIGRLNKQARQFCVEKFLVGEKTGKKYSPQRIVELMKEARDEKNEYALFSSSELLTIKQVKSLLGRLSTYFKSQNKAGSSKSPHPEIPDATTLLDLIPTVVQDQDAELMRLPSGRAV